MARQVLNLKDLQSWVPAYDARRLDKVSVMGGQNFAHGVNGPGSAFGSVFSDYNNWLVGAGKITELLVGDTYFYGTIAGIFRMNKDNRQLEPIIEITVLEEARFWPWTVAEVGGLYYFSQFNIGLWQYDPLSNTVQKITTPFGDNIRGIGASYNRLIALGDRIYGWSSTDDGTDFNPSLLTGAGAQVFLVGTEGFRIDATDDGFIVATNLGVMKATTVSAEYVWQHSVHSKNIRIFSPNAGANIPDVGIVYLDTLGFHIIAPGSVPADFQQDMGSFLKDGVIKEMDESKHGCLQVYFSRAANSLFVATAVNDREGRYSQTFQWDKLSNKWGSFDDSHFGMLETFFSVTNKFTCGFMGVDRYIHVFAGSPYIEALPAGGFCLADFLLRDPVEVPMLNLVTPTETTGRFPGNLINLAISEIHTADTDPTLRLDRIGALLTNPFNPSTPYYLPQIGLNSQVDIGPFRFVNQLDSDGTSAISQLVLGLSRGTGFILNENLNTEAGTENLNTDADEIDTLGTLYISDNFNSELITSDDGMTDDPLQGPELLLFSELIGSSLQLFPFGFSGVFHKLRLSATSAGQNYSVKTIDISGQPTGRRF